MKENLMFKVPFVILIDDLEDFIKVQLILLANNFNWNGGQKFIKKESLNYIPKYIKVKSNYRMVYGDTINNSSDFTFILKEDIYQC